MAEYINIPAQTVAIGANVIFNDTLEKGCENIRHREGSGIVTLRGGHRYLVMFGGNVTGPTADVPVSFALAINGEPLGSGTMIITPAAPNELNNISAAAYITVPRCCCYQVAVENMGTEAATVQNANLIVVMEDRA